MKRAIILASLLGFLSACADQDSTQDQDKRPDWIVIASDGVSIGEMSLRSWCDPGIELEEVAVSSEATLASVRLAAAKVRSAGVTVREAGVRLAHDDLVMLAEFVAAMHHLASMTTADAFIRSDQGRSKLEYLNLEQDAILFRELTDEERDEMRAGKDVSHYMMRALAQVQDRQRSAVAAASAIVTQKQRAISERAEAASLVGPSISVDPVVVVSASACVSALIDKRMTAN
ncbi:hypothetical protein [Arenimonas metalli]|uniref:DUF4142 domain-containing protein n=1 Tax=Arenimonas metalli CF5-1 TaxID=1384056 RepID=A0A091B031_9GAMM|nr:hypothetical protein [Arenimonas metalli]KFN44254.1 hypothetical protein N787_13735 [Arenimonas metalli CF5-1]